MIVNLKFKNYRSYRDEAEFSLVALPSEYNSGAVTTIELDDGSQLRLLNTAAIFGANAAGKSNVIYALSGLSEMVKESLSYNQSHPVPLYLPYGLDLEYYTSHPTELAVDFTVKGRRYLYNLTVDDKGISAEELAVYAKDNLNSIYLRKRNADDSIDLQKGEAWPSTVDFNGTMLLPNQLLLSWLATKAADGLQDVADYLASLMIQTPQKMLFGGKQLNKVAEELFDGGKSPIFKRFVRLMQIADLGIYDTLFTRHDDSDFNIPQSVPAEIQKAFIEDNRWEFRLVHNMDNEEKKCVLPLELESEGTKALFRVSPYILYALENGLFLAYDEISTAIHPALFRLLINLFHNPKSNPKGAQLIFTTHDASAADYNTLRADQIWFAEKHNGCSELFSVQDFDDVSVNVPFETWYRAGRFGALPTFGSIDFIFE